MKMKKTVLALAFISTLTLAACGNTEDTKENTATTSSSEKIDLNALELPQLTTAVADNEDLVEIETTEGIIKAKLFPELAPKAVENFMTHAKEGYYDGIIFHRVVEGFMIQGGDPEGTGMGGESIWGEGFETETSKQLYNIRGALAMARSQDPNSNGSQFFIVQNDDDVSDGLAIQKYPEAIIEAYQDGGTPQLDGDYAVFGQVIEGMDVVDTIAKAEVKDNGSGETSSPVEPASIKTIKILQEAK